MADSRQVRLYTAFRRLTEILSLLCILLGVLVLSGWISGKPALVQLVSGYNPMRFNTAVCLIAAAVALLLSAGEPSKARTRAAHALGLFTLAVGFCSLIEWALGVNLHIDELLWKDTFSPSNPGRMVPVTAVSYVLIALFFILQGAERAVWSWIRQCAALGTNLLAQWSILNVIFRDNKQEGIAVPTAGGFFLLSMGMILTPGTRGFLAPLLNPSAGGRLLRNLLMPSIIVPLFAGWIYILLNQANLVDVDGGTSIMVVLSSAVLLILIVWTSSSIDGIDLRLSAIIESTDDAIISKSLDGTILSWNPGAEQLYGYTAAEAIGKSIEIVVPPEFHSKIQSTLDRIRDGNVVRLHDSVRMRKDGTLFNASVTLSPVKDARGGIVGCSAISRDITERKKVEAELRRASMYSRSLIEASLDPLVTISREGKITDANEATEKVTEVSREHLIGTDFSDYFTNPEKAREGYRQVFADGMIRDYPLAVRSASGVITEVLYNATIFRNEEGEAEGVFAAARDVTERNRVEQARKKAEASLRELNRELEHRVEMRTAELHQSEQRVRKKLDSILSPEGDPGNLDLADVIDVPEVQSLVDDIFALTRVPCWILDLKGNVLVGAGWQEACTKFHRSHSETCQNCLESDRELSTGVGFGEFKIYKCKNNMWDAVTPLKLGDRHMGNLFCGQFFFSDEEIDFDLFAAQAKKYGFDEEDYLAAIHRVPKMTREQVQTGMSLYIKLAEVLSKLGYSGIKLARAMNETAQANTELIAKAKELEAFAYSVSHDLRAPLRHVDGFLTLLSNKHYASLDEQGKHYIDCTLDSSRRMGQLIDDLLQFSRLGRSEIHKTKVDLNALIGEVRAGLGSDTDNRIVNWHVDSLPEVAADSGMLRQVFENLLGNALKFTRDCATAEITIGCRHEASGELILFVRDNGAGFDMRYYDKLFQVFQRLHSEQEFDGTGIGLAIARRVIERHGGRIWAEGKVGAGATFYISLPDSIYKSGGQHGLTEAHLVG